jgi:hypothetical protein
MDDRCVLLRANTNRLMWRNDTVAALKQSETPLNGDALALIRSSW